MTREQHVYFMRAVAGFGPLKIGIAIDPVARLAQVSACSPFPLELVHSIPGGRSVEKSIHDSFADCHSHGEWFHDSPRLLKFIADIQAGADVPNALGDGPKRSARYLQMVATRLRNGTENVRPRVLQADIDLVLARRGDVT